MDLVCLYYRSLVFRMHYHFKTDGAVERKHMCVREIFLMDCFYVLSSRAVTGTMLSLPVAAWQGLNDQPEMHIDISNQ